MFRSAFRRGRDGSTRILSHAAIIVREFGIPAVTGTGDAVRIMTSGNHYTVNGTTGVVNADNFKRLRACLRGCDQMSVMITYGGVRATKLARKFRVVPGHLYCRDPAR